jgi:hypothetical protein
MGERREVLATPQKLGVSVLFDVVRVEFLCGDSYAAQVLYDDLLDRLRDGEGLTLSVQQPAPETE